MIAHKWQPIAPLSEECDFDFSEIDALQRQWTAYRRTRESAQPDAYAEFIERLTRSWAIETGIIEGLYTLDRGMTETLVMRGISAELIERSATNKDPHELARTLADHQDAVNGVYAEVREGRPVSRSAIRQIHVVLTGNQPTYRAMNQFGRFFDAELRHGEFKTLPNNPTRPDGAVHEYCPPEHVDSELDNLMEWYAAYLQDDARYHPLLTAAWLHHRFTQIHPFQDGNGRVVRALLTWHLVREGYLPVVVTRDDRVDYIDALEKADDGDLVLFVDLLVRMQRRTILEAIGEPERAETVDQVLDHIVEQIGRKNTARDARLRSLNAVAEELREQIGDWLDIQAERIVSRLEQAGRNVEPSVITGGAGVREHWYHDQVVQTAKNSGHWVNLNEFRYYVSLTLTPDLMPLISRLVFVISLHHTGRQLSGIMASTAFALIDHYPDGIPDQVEAGAASSFIDCTPSQPFTFTWEDSPDVLMPHYTTWIEQSLAIALRQWGEHLA